MLSCGKQVTGLWTVWVAHPAARRARDTVRRLGESVEGNASDLEPCRISCRHRQSRACCPNELGRVVQVDEFAEFLYCAVEK